MSVEASITVQELSKCYQIYDRPQDRLLQMLLRGRKQFFREFWALKDISFEVKPGEAFGVIGRNGSGKSTLLQILAGTLSPTSGHSKISGRVAALLELGSGFNPEFTGRDNVFLNGQILGLSKRDIEDRYDQIVAFADIGEHLDQPVKTYSSGMFVRLAFAVQAHIDASVIIIDEALTVGDVFFRQKCYTRLEELRKSGASILLVSHSMGDIEQYCQRALVLNAGKQEFIGSASQAVKNYYLLHQQLQSSPLKLAPSAYTNKKPPTQITSPPIQADANLSTQKISLDLPQTSQISNGKATCKSVTLCNSEGAPCHSFHQGDQAIFYYEFELDDEVEIPICGVVLKNDRGIIVHGKNSWQYDKDIPLSLGIKSRVICRQQISLNLQPGEYTFEVAMACVEKKWWQQRESISYDEIVSKFDRICYVPDAGSFTIGFALRDGVTVLTHHGIADLPGDLTIEVAPSEALERSSQDLVPLTKPGSSHSPHQDQSSANHEEPALFHITHWKSGSQWIHKILLALFPDRIISPQIQNQQFFEKPLVPGGIYPTVYVTREEFLSVNIPFRHEKLVVVRDLRDTLVSGYFSIRYSHALVDGILLDWRERLDSMSLEDGLIMLMEEWLPRSARIQRTWLESGEKIIHYEDLLSRDIEILEEALAGQCKFSISPDQLQKAVIDNRFEAITKGRKPGKEDIFSHERKGVQGDWVQYFTPTVLTRFNQEYGNLLAGIGYQ